MIDLQTAILNELYSFGATLSAILIIVSLIGLALSWFGGEKIRAVVLSPVVAWFLGYLCGVIGTLTCLKLML